MTTLPMLPIRGMVMFPFMRTPFPVGRKSSVLALEEAMAGNRKLLMATQRDASVNDPKPADIFGVGTIVNIVESRKLPDGNIKLLVEGIERARVISVSSGDGLLRATVETFSGEVNSGPQLDAWMHRVAKRTGEYVNLARRRAETLELPEDEPGKLADTVCANLPMTLEDKQQLLEIFDPFDRLTRVADILDSEIGKLKMLDGTLEMLRHTVATLAYRGAKAMRGAPPEFARYRPAADSRTPGEILAHMGDLMDWALGMCDGRHHWHNSPPLAWNEGVARFFAALEAFDRRLSTGAPLGFPAEKIFQGPIADALTHVGQIAMLRRTAGCKMRGENYFAAKIAVGRAGADQADPVAEFD
jgi:Lon protease-like protein